MVTRSRLKKWGAYLMVKEKGKMPYTEWAFYELGKKSTKADVIEAVKRDSRHFGKNIEILDVG